VSELSSPGKNNKGLITHLIRNSLSYRKRLQTSRTPDPT
jgi:hypothetical protein